MRKRNLLAVASLGAAAAAVVAIAAHAGDLNPPAGPVAPTMLPLDQVEARTPVQSLSGDVDSLFVISQSGSYYLTGNITGASGMNGVSVTADDVTIDLNGFSLIGVAGSDHGVSIGAGVERCTIRNGGIRSWGGTGVFGDQANQCRVDEVRVAMNQNGLDLGDFAHVSRCAASDNTFGGLSIDEEGLIKECTANDNGNVGMALSNRSSALDCVSTDNGTGIAVVRGLVHRCVAAFNTTDIANPFPAETTLIDNHTD